MMMILPTAELTMYGMPSSVSVAAVREGVAYDALATSSPQSYHAVCVMPTTSCSFPSVPTQCVASFLLLPRRCFPLLSRKDAHPPKFPLLKYAALPLLPRFFFFILPYHPAQPKPSSNALHHLHWFMAIQSSSLPHLSLIISIIISIMSIMSIISTINIIIVTSITSINTTCIINNNDNLPHSTYP
ncbi:hypothetical protein EDD37DRAFT_11458 [Exophiala viscosa]|uniref:uncharacterized protein n=1 Tax=Exophiala viscosa TaxID=2486360 RepID=UPI00218FAD3D|nr:hypothetical protein EDD37DRAFT_11458 [Exophiala viscosa]